MDTSTLPTDPDTESPVDDDSTDEDEDDSDSQSHPRWALPLLIIGLTAVVIALGYGLYGLTLNPVQSTNNQGITTLKGNFDLFRCLPQACDGYIQAGATSVFVRFPTDCSAPDNGMQIIVTAKRDYSLGSNAYMANECAKLP